MKEKTSSLKYLKIFFLALSFTILLSIIFRFVNLTQNSSFKNNTFSLLYISKESRVIYVDKKANTVFFLSVGDVGSIVKGKSPFIATIALGIPINAIIYDEDKNKNPDLNEFITFENQARLTLGFGHTFKNLNEYDLHKIMSIARSAKKDSTNSIKVNLLDEKSVKENISDIFLDSEIKNSKYSVEIVNGIDVNGLASSLASVLMKLGYNVVFLQSVPGTYTDDSYVGYEIEKDLFVNSLLALTKFEEKNKTISRSADVTIYLGSDLQSQFND